MPGDAHDREGVHSRFPKSSKHCMAQGVQDEIATENGAAFAVDLRRRYLAVKVIDRGPQILFAFPVRKDQSGYSVTGIDGLPTTQSEQEGVSLGQSRNLSQC